jgi:GTP-binding protein
MLKHLSEIIISQRERFSLQPIITKVDDIPPAEAERQIDSIRDSIKSTMSFCMPPIVTSATMGLGIDTLRRNMEVACGLATLSKREEGT